MPRELTLFCMAAFLFIAVILVLFFAVQTQKKEQVVHYYEALLPILDEMILNIRKTQHNYSNAIQTIASLPQSFTDYHSLAAALEQYSSHITRDALPAQLLHFDNKLLTALLYSKLCLAAEKNIHLEILIHDYFYSSRINEFQIIDLTGILLDNAIEASHAEDYIYVEIGSSMQKKDSCLSGAHSPFILTVKNPGPQATQDFMKQIFSPNYSSKAEDHQKHGLGLSYLKTIVHRHRGQIEISNEMIPSATTEEPVRYFVFQLII